MPTTKKKLIEVALPLDDINAQAAREKSIRHGHPSTLHLWWARRPLAACRAVLFAQLVDDPSAHPDRFPTPEAQQTERERLFDLIRELVKWENVNNEALLEQARAEIRASAGPGGPPPLLDPFAGGGSIPLEGQRLGLEVHASDLNPVAVLINKALVEIPPRFAGLPPVHPAAQPDKRTQAKLLSGGAAWKGAAGLAEDVRRYGAWMRQQAEQRIGRLYPKYRLTAELLEARPDLAAQGYKAGSELTVIAWLWARTVACPNPACGAAMPLVRSFDLSTKQGRRAWVEPAIERSSQPPRVGFTVCVGSGKGPEGTKLGRGSSFSCLVCEQSANERYIKDEGVAGRMGAQLMAVVAEGTRGRVYLPPTREHERAAVAARPTWRPEAQMPDNPRWFSPPAFGMTTFGDLFTGRQLVALTTFSDLVMEAHARVLADAQAAAGRDARAYADAVATYLAFAVDKGANYWSTICAWHTSRDIVVSTFARQALPMVWDYAEANPLSNSSGNFELGYHQAASMLDNLPARPIAGKARQQDAAALPETKTKLLISTDPPYYDNIGYADLSDFFYLWLRKSLASVYPNLLTTLLVPKADELVATPYRFGGSKDKAFEFFESGLRTVFSRTRALMDERYPVTIYYAFKQSETDGPEEDSNGADEQVVSSGWDSMLEGLIRSGLAVVGTWPMRTELVTSLKKNVSALASSIVLVCRARAEDAPRITRRDFLAALKRELPPALHHLQQANIAPVDLAQAAIGPGMAIYSRYSRVLESDGSSLRVRTALALINQALDEYLAEQESEYDADTRWALAWFEQHEYGEGLFGDADVLARAKDTSVAGMAEAGFLSARAGKVRLLRRDELPAGWDPAADRRLAIWEAAQHLARALEQGGEQAAAGLLAGLGPSLGEVARDLAYRLYVLCERKGWAAEALAYNTLVVAWPELEKLARELAYTRPTQARLV